MGGRPPALAVHHGRDRAELLRARLGGDERVAPPHGCARVRGARRRGRGLGRTPRALVGNALSRLLGWVVSARHRRRAARSTLARVLRRIAARGAGLAPRPATAGPLVSWR